jgi:hypothetical protein
MIKSLFMNLIGGKFVSKLSLRLFFAQKQIQSTTCNSPPARQLALGAITTQQECESLGPQIKLPAKKCHEPAVAYFAYTSSG